MQGYGLFHSAGHILPHIKNNNDVKTYAPIKASHTSTDIGAKNENKLGGAFVGFLYRILIPKLNKKKN